MKGGVLTLLLAAGFLISCERTIDGLIDPGTDSPYLHEIQLFPDSFNTDTILVNGGTLPGDMITISTTCIVIAEAAPGSGIPSIGYAVSLPARSRVYAEGTLRDDGISPDLNAGDGIHAGVITFTIPRVESGMFELAVTGRYGDGPPSNTIRRFIPVFRSNRAPILGPLSAPDTVVLPPSGEVTLIRMTVAAADSDGAGDLESVFFRNLDSPSDTTRKFLLYDDGHATGISGDSTANDGIYTIIVQLPSSTPAATYRFLFQALDRAGLGSNTILHPLTVVAPE